MLRASWRDTMILLKEFRHALSVFLVAVLGGGLLYYSIALQVDEPLQNLSEAIYVVLALAFFNPRGIFRKALISKLFSSSCP